MDHLIDLDLLAERVLVAAQSWKEHAWMSALTWRDEASTWPQPIIEDREQVRIPESLGFRLRTTTGELKLVAWIGGWFDIELLKDDEILPRYAEFIDLDGAYGHIVNTVDEFLR